MQSHRCHGTQHIPEANSQQLKKLQDVAYKLVHLQATFVQHRRFRNLEVSDLKISIPFNHLLQRTEWVSCRTCRCGLILRYILLLSFVCCWGCILRSTFALPFASVESINTDCASPHEMSVHGIYGVPIRIVRAFDYAAPREEEVSFDDVPLPEESRSPAKQFLPNAFNFQF